MPGEQSRASVCANSQPSDVMPARPLFVRDGDELILHGGEIVGLVDVPVDLLLAVLKQTPLVHRESHCALLAVSQSKPPEEETKKTSWG